MIYAAFIMWFFLLIFIGIGVYHIAARLIGGRAVSWILLPGTLISEMAWILGALVTGGGGAQGPADPGRRWLGCGRQ